MATTPSSAARIRIALVGCGRIAEKHFEAIRAHSERLELTAVCDVDRSGARCARWHRTGVRGFAIPRRSLLADGDADVSCCARRAASIRRQTMQIAAAGRHVITEKPMATRWATASAWSKPATPPTCACSSSSRTVAMPPCSCSSARSSRSASVASTWSISTCSGADRRATTTAPGGAAPGSLMAAR